MKRLSLISILTCSFAAVALLIPALNADPVKHRTEITLSGPTEIPGMVLGPGTYVMKVPDPYTHRDMVGFYNLNESHLYKLVRTVPAYRNFRTGRTVITFEERANGAPQAIHTWFEPAAFDGYEFVYPKAEVQTVAENTPPPAPLAPPPAPAAVAPAPAPVAQAAPPAEAPVEVAQAAPPPAPQAAPAPAPAPQPAPPELPKTASNFPMMLEAGGFFVLAGLCLRLRA